MDAFIQGFTEVMKAIGTHGPSAVWMGICFVGAIALAIVGYRGFIAGVTWARGHVDRWIVKYEARREMDEIRNERLAEAVVRQTETSEKASEGIQAIAKQTEKQTEFMERMDHRLDDHGRRLDEHGTALTKILGHLFGEEKRGD
jgi:hypothetical protein